MWLSENCIIINVNNQFCSSFPRLRTQRMLTQRRLQVPTYTTLNPGGTTRKLTAWAGSQNRQELWKVGMIFSLVSNQQ